MLATPEIEWWTLKLCLNTTHHGSALHSYVYLDLSELFPFSTEEFCEFPTCCPRGCDGAVSISVNFQAGTCILILANIPMLIINMFCDLNRAQYPPCCLWYFLF